MRLGLISALQQEQHGLVDSLQSLQKEQRAMREYAVGKLWGMDCVAVLSRLGKVAAAATVATLIERYGVTHIVFTGVAGSADPQVRVGDVVVADTLIQHDMDATPLFPRFEVPLTGLARFPSDLALTDRLASAAEGFFDEDVSNAISEDDRTHFHLQRPRVHRGLIGSADEFMDNAARLQELKRALPDLLAVEMEGAAVAQVCFEFGIPFAVIRTISDSADEAAPVDFM
ncbi:5'-methylthioadenosine/adenosylhomocysteine nucleosidase, partial [Oxalobacteraceae bacterium OM1]